MTKEQINKLLNKGIFPEKASKRELIETHISWVIVSDPFVYKIKKTVHYSFLDFSTLEMRKHFCKREIELNKRLTKNIYLDVLPVCEWEDNYIMGGKAGTIIEYAVRMHKLDREKQMDQLLIKNKVSKNDIKNIAEKIAFFHKNTDIIYNKDSINIQEKFNDLESEKQFLSKHLDMKYCNIISHAIDTSDSFLHKNKKLLEDRLDARFIRDCHGDLHSRNIFLLPEPVPFDCIEFNDDFRQIDVLNEVAFLCMDLDAFERQDLSDLFIDYYNQFFPAMQTKEDYNLFIYFKSYRANIRAKVNSLRAKTATDNLEKINTLSATKKYLLLMDSYLRSTEFLE